MLIDKRGHFGRSASSSVSEKHRGALQNLVRAAQLVVLALEPLDLLTLLRGRQIRPQTLIGLDLAHTLSQRLGRQPDVLGDMRDRPPGLQHEPHTAVDQLLGVLPWTWHRRRISSPEDRTPSFQSLRQIQASSATALPHRNLQPRLNPGT